VTRPRAPAQEHDKGKQAFDDVSFRCPFERIAKHLSDFVDDLDFVQQCKEVYYQVLFPSTPLPTYKRASIRPLAILQKLSVLLARCQCHKLCDSGLAALARLPICVRTPHGRWCRSMHGECPAPALTPPAVRSAEAVRTFSAARKV
jgi:hypothetical protein